LGDQLLSIRRAFKNSAHAPRENSELSEIQRVEFIQVNRLTAARRNFLSLRFERRKVVETRWIWQLAENRSVARRRWLWRMLFARWLPAASAATGLPMSAAPTTAAAVTSTFALVAFPKIAIASATATTAAFLPLTLRLTAAAALNVLSAVAATRGLSFVGRCAVWRCAGLGLLGSSRCRLC
jgi:hypothetical protein